MAYKPQTPFSVPMKLLIPVYTTVKGVRKKTFTTPEDGILFFGSFRTFGGTESTSNDLYTIFDTATIETWYRPEIKADCRVYLCDSEQIFEVIGSPENIEMRNQFLKFRVQSVGGGA